MTASKGQVRELLNLTWPILIRNYLSCGSAVFGLALVGWWDGDVAHYDGAGIGKMYSNITGEAPLASGSTTLAGGTPSA